MCLPPPVIQRTRSRFNSLTISDDPPQSAMNWPPHDPKHRINDNVYGTVKIPAPIDKIIDTAEFQRLRNLKQTGLVYTVFPNCEHSRFVHSLGTFSLAFRLLDKLRHSQPSLGITVCDHMCVSIAALLHDVGHGPYSHLFDGEFAKRCGNAFKHEEMSVKIIARIMDKPEIRRSFQPFLGETDDEYMRSVKFIEECITAKPFDFINSKVSENIFRTSSKEEIRKHVESEWNEAVDGRGVEKAFLYDIVNNSFSVHDVDKMDYLLRDSKASGVAITFSNDALSRLFDHVRVVIDPNCGLKRIAYSKKCEGDIKSIGDSRLDMHSKVYQHKTVRYIETLVVEALFNAGELLQYEGANGKMFPLTRVTEDVDAFLKTSDFVEQEILNSTSTDPKMLAAKELLGRVKQRKTGCKLGGFELSPEKAKKHANNESGTPEESVKLIAEKMRQQLPGLDTKYQVMSSLLSRGLDAETHPIQRQVFYDGKPKDTDGEPMIGYYVDEDYVLNNCPKMATKWEIFVMGDRDLSPDQQRSISTALRLSAETLQFLTPRKRSPTETTEALEAASSSSSHRSIAKRALPFSKKPQDAC